MQGGIGQVEKGGKPGAPSRRKTPRTLIPDEALSRITESVLVPGNDIRLLKDAAENYPAWLEAIGSAERYIHFESYIIHDDEQGRLFADALIAKAREGVRVRIIYDWVGGFGKTSSRFWKRLAEGGVEIRCYNPFDFLRPLGWINRDHRKILSVDGRIAFVTGLCIGQMWVGYPDKDVAPWRDTGVSIRGKAVADVERSFAEIWDSLGDPLPATDIADAADIPDSGSTSARIVSGPPGGARIYRLDHLLASTARESLWLTDAYFSGTDVYVEALGAAADDGVDVRLLVPAANDIVIMSAVSRSGYRALLERGVRIFEWNGPMLHAKTAVVDGCWSRVGSTNLNISSWVGNAEIDVVVEGEEFGRQMQDMYLADLENATEIVLDEKALARPVGGRRRKRHRMVSSEARSARYAPTAIVIGSALSSSVYRGARQSVGPIEWKITMVAAALLLATFAIALKYPRIIAVPIGIAALWLAVSLSVNSIRSYSHSRKAAASAKRPEGAAEPSKEGVS